VFQDELLISQEAIDVLTRGQGFVSGDKRHEPRYGRMQHGDN
jgi:hypothetical protein